MSSTIAKYFGSKRGKRKHISTSSTSDSCTSPEVDKTKEQKKLRTDSDTDSDEEMATESMLQEINNKLELLAETRADVAQIRQEMDKLTQSLINKIEKLESAVFDMGSAQDKLKSEVAALWDENKNLLSQIKQEKKDYRTNQTGSQ